MLSHGAFSRCFDPRPLACPLSCLLDAAIVSGWIVTADAELFMQNPRGAIGILQEVRSLSRPQHHVPHPSALPRGLALPQLREGTLRSGRI